MTDITLADIQKIVAQAVCNTGGSTLHGHRAAEEFAAILTNPARRAAEIAEYDRVGQMHPGGDA